MSYIVLRQTEKAVATERTGLDGWEQLPGFYDATGADKACRDAAEISEQAGTYVAIPERSFGPVKIQFEQVRRTIVGEPPPPRSALTAAADEGLAETETETEAV